MLKVENPLPKDAAEGAGDGWSALDEEVDVFEVIQAADWGAGGCGEAVGK